MLLWKSQRILQIPCPCFFCVDGWRTFFNLEVQFNLIYFISSKSLWNDKNQLFILQIRFLLIFFFLLHFLLPLFRSFNFLNFCWSIVDLQCCVTLSCATKWISYTYTYIHYLPFFLLVSLNVMWDLSSPTRDWTCAPSIERAVLTTIWPGKSPLLHPLLQFFQAHSYADNN